MDLFHISICFLGWGWLGASAEMFGQKCLGGSVKSKAIFGPQVKVTFIIEKYIFVFDVILLQGFNNLVSLGFINPGILSPVNN